MNKSCFSLVLLLFAFAAFSATKVELEYDKTASAEVSENKADQLITVSLKFLPVTTLDPVTNDEMTEVLAEFFAEEAVSSFLKRPKAIVFSKTRKSIQNKTDKEYSVTYSIPVSALVEVKEKKESVSAEVLKKSFHSETTSLLQDFRSTCFHDLRVTEAVFLEQIETAKDKTTLKEKICDAFSAFEKKVEKDDELFLSEKEELTQKAKRIKNHLLEKLSANKENVGGLGKAPESISRANITPEYRPILFSDSILLETEGCKAIEMPDGSIYIIAVGRTVARGDSASNRILHEKIAEQKAYGEMAKYEGGEVHFFAQETKTKVSKQGLIEQYEKKKTKTITLRADKYLSYMSTVGTWYSADGKLFYLAKGFKLPPGEQE